MHFSGMAWQRASDLATRPDKQRPAMEETMLTRRKFLTRRLATTTTAVLVALASSPGLADAADIFAGKQIRVIIPGGTAGGYALYGQLAAQHLTRFIPGNPGVAISYMPGASGLNAMNHLYEVASKDGTVIAVMQQDLASNQARRLNGVRYDAARFNYIIRATSNVPVHMIWHTAKAASIEELKKHEVVTGAVGTGGTHNDLPHAQNALIGTKWKVIGGYKGNDESRIAMERGEVQAAVSPATLFNEQLRPWREQGKVKVVVQYADFRHPGLPEVPSVVELTDDPEAKAVFRFLVSLSTLGRAFGLPPGVPAETVAVLRKAFTDMINDPVFRADAEKRGADLHPMKGDELAADINRVIMTPPGIVRKTNEVIAKR
jgi:tripartite-type tricarboxylate transporter receptor subunit TctC